MIYFLIIFDSLLICLYLNFSKINGKLELLSQNIGIKIIQTCKSIPYYEDDGCLIELYLRNNYLFNYYLLIKALFLLH